MCPGCMTSNPNYSVFPLTDRLLWHMTSSHYSHLIIIIYLSISTFMSFISLNEQRKMLFGI